MPAEGTLVMEDAELLFKNFAGRASQFNAAGDRNFCIKLDPDTAAAMANDGWNVKQTKPKSAEYDVVQYIQVSVKYHGRNGPMSKPPRLVLITSRGRTDLPEEMCEILDQVEIARVDLIIRPYMWDVNGKTGIKAYLKSIYVTIVEDELELRYNQLPELGVDGAQKAIESSTPEEFIEGESWFEDNEPLEIGA